MRDRERAFSLLAEAGYKPQSRVILDRRLTCYFVHGFDFARDGVQVDLHWCLSRHPSFHIDEATIWHARRPFQLAGRGYDVLADEHEIMFAVLSLLRDAERGRPKIKNIVDLLRILAMLDERLDWDTFLEARRTDGTLGPTVNVLGVCLDVATARENLPRLRGALERYRDRRVPVRGMSSPFRFSPESFGLGNKLWCARVYDTSPLTWFLWWATSLPFRVAVHERRLRKRPSTTQRPSGGQG